VKWASVHGTGKAGFGPRSSTLDPQDSEEAQSRVAESGRPWLGAERTAATPGENIISCIGSR